MKQNKKAKNYAVFCFAGKKKLLFYIYAVIVKQKIYKRSTNHYFGQTQTTPWSLSLFVPHHLLLVALLAPPSGRATGYWNIPQPPPAKEISCQALPCVFT
jgi:hypothetical protein